MVIVMGSSSQLCCYCNEITERTCDGDRLACSMCGRPYLVAPDQPMPYACPATGTRDGEQRHEQRHGHATRLSRRQPGRLT